MTEWSGWWTTSNPAVGDGPVSFTQVDLAKIVRILAACSGFEGVAPGYLNELAPTANGANTVAVNTGGAVVDGKAYLNDASVNVNVPSAVGAATRASTASYCASPGRGRRRRRASRALRAWTRQAQARPR
jgi:hypothetical protein